MTNFDPGRFLLNFVANMADAMQTSARANLQNAQNMQNSQQSLFQQQTPTPQTLFPGTTAQLAQTAAQLAEMNQNQTNQMMKELLNMPKDLTQLLEQLTLNQGGQNGKGLLFLVNSTLDIMKLSSMLQSMTKDASANLYKMLAQFNQLGMNLKEEQIIQLTKIISVVSNSSNSDVQSVRTLMLMYLPWLPLTDPNALKFEIDGKNGGGGADGTDSITIMIQTENYGNIGGTLIKTDNDGIRADITTSKTFPVENLKAFFKETAQKHSININCFTEVKSEFDKDKAKPSETKVCMNSSPGVNPFLLLISGEFIKCVHEIDTRENLREQRKEMLG